MATTYSPKLSDNFTLTVTMPATLGASPSSYDILTAGVQSAYSTIPMTTFDGRKEIPALPKVTFYAACLYLEYKPGDDEEWVLPGTSATHTVTIDQHTFTGFLQALQFKSQNFGEGLKGLVVTPMIAYAGTRADNCSSYS